MAVDDVARAPAGFKEFKFTTRDGLRLYARRYPARVNMGLRPVLCLAGLTRNSRDFDIVARALSSDARAPREVLTVDMRGRGFSEHDRDWRNYAIPVEMQDVLDFMTMAELGDAGIIGTSRGGLITMVMAAAQPGRLGPVVLNDIGPVIESDGLLRIAGYVGRVPAPKSWGDAARTVLELTRRDFPALGEAGAEALARQLFNEKNGKPIAGYDAKLSKCLSVLDGPIPALWPQFDCLKRVPVMVIRGSNSDLLSDKTIDEMQRRHPRFTRHLVPGEGHAPLLWDSATVAAIAAFFAGTDHDRRHAGARAA
ncbi:MAG: alpha/beta fold hydrolase [Hyphomicrobium sp.]